MQSEIFDIRPPIPLIFWFIQYRDDRCKHCISDSQIVDHVVRDSEIHLAKGLALIVSVG
jgi:hypothetical protein